MTADLHVVAVDSDRLYPPRLSEELVAAAPTAAPLRTVESDYGHDGFLIETHQVGAVVRDALGCRATVRCPHARCPAMARYRSRECSNGRWTPVTRAPSISSCSDRG